MKKHVLILFSIVFLMTAGGGDTKATADIVDSMEFQGQGIELTLEQAIEAVLKDSPVVKESNLNLEQAQVEYEQNKSQIRKNKASNNIGNENSITYLQSVTLPQLTAEFNIDNAKRSHEATIEGLKADIEQAYFNLLHAEQSEQINRESLEVTKELYEITKQKYQLGLVSRQEVLNSELSCINAENDYKAAVDAVKNAKMQFNAKMGYNVMTEVKLKDELQYKEFNPGSIAEAVSRALTNRMEVKSAEFAYEKEKINLDIIARQYPEITYMHRKQKVAVEKALKALEDTKKNIEIEVRQNYLEVMQKKEAIKSAEKSVELSEEALKLNRTFHEANMAVPTDVQKAETALKQAKTGLSKAILDYNLAVLKFEDSIGVGRN